MLGQLETPGFLVGDPSSVEMTDFFPHFFDYSRLLQLFPDSFAGFEALRGQISDFFGGFT